MYTAPGKKRHKGDPDQAGLIPADTGRYRLLETVRQFAEEKLSEAGQHNTVMCRHRDFYTTWAAENRTRLGGPNSAYWFERFEIEHDNLRAAITCCRAQGEKR